MDRDADFYHAIIDSVTEHIAVIDQAGTIHYVNQGWVEFADSNNCRIKGDWDGINYLDTCDASASMGEAFGGQAAAGIRNVLQNKINIFYFEYPCHSHDEKRWFMMRVTPLNLEGEPRYVISHQNITERKLAEERVEELSRLDGLTGIANRRSFDQFLGAEWRRCQRLKLPLSLALLDIDHFKLLNDHRGHQAGDECLRRIGEIFKNFGKRPGDLVARYGGEEFAVILGNTSLDEAINIAEQLLKRIRDAGIENTEAPTGPTVTASIGVATLYPDRNGDASILIKAADELLYSAKESGRNRVAS